MGRKNRSPRKATNKRGFKAKCVHRTKQKTKKPWSKGKRRTTRNRGKTPNPLRHVLHPKIAQEAGAALARDEYETAVFQALREVEINVRKAGGHRNADIGTVLMRKAFGPKGTLSDKQALEAEEENLAHLFAGTIGFHKNPTSHRKVSMTRTKATRIMVIASHLLSIVEERKQQLQTEANQGIKGSTYTE